MTKYRQLLIAAFLGGVGAFGFVTALAAALIWLGILNVSATLH